MAQMQACESCGATIYPEHVDQGRAGRWAGQLLCAVCYAEKRSEGGEAVPAAEAAPVPVQPVQPAKPAQDEDEPISLVDSPESNRLSSRIQTIGAGVSGVESRRQFNRKPAVTGQGACRVRTFHSKLQIESIEFMDNAINGWLDDNPDIEVKFVTTTIGTMSGKFPEPNLILNVWY